MNMNWMLYDPLVGLILSPDINVSFPDFTQSFNRYSYALNNPLKFTDTDGNNPMLAALLIWGAFYGGAQANTNGQNVWKGMLIGAASGAITQGVGFLTSSMGIINQSIVMGGTAFATTGLGSVVINGNWDMNSSLMAGGMAFGMGMLQLIGNGNLYSEASTEPSRYDPSNPGGDLTRVKSRAALKHIKKGDFGLGELATNGGHGETVDIPSGHFKSNVTGKFSDGYTYRKAWSWKNGISMHISPYASYMDEVNLDAILVNEGTHMFHYYLGLDKEMSHKEFVDRTEYSTYTHMKNEILKLPADKQAFPSNVERLNQINEAYY